MANKNFTFVDSLLVSRELTLADESILPSEKERVSKKINLFKNKTLLVNLFPGLRSSLGKNNILNSKIYNDDIKFKSKNAFVDKKRESLNKTISTDLNPSIFKKTYGLECTFEDVEQIKSKPFSDITLDSKSNLKFNDFKNYTMLVDDHGLKTFAGSISVFNRREEVLRLLITERNLKGISASLITTAENFNVMITESFNSVKTSNGISIEETQINAFFDMPNENTTNPFELTTNYKNELRFVNKSVYLVKVFNSNDNKTIKSLFPTPNYYDTKQNSIKPFRDVDFDESDINFNNNYSKYRRYPSHGISLNRRIESTVTSIAYRGERD